MTARTLAAAALVAVLGTALAQQPKAGLAPAAPPPKVADKSDLPKLLATRVTVERFDGKFKDAVKLLADAYDGEWWAVDSIPMGSKAWQDTWDGILVINDLLDRHVRGK